MKLVATIYEIISPLSLSSTFLIEGVLRSKTYLAKVDRRTQKHFETPSAILGSPGDHFGFIKFSWKELSNQKLISQNLIGRSNNLRLDIFPDPVGHFWTHWRPFWISWPLIGRNRSARIKKLI